MRFFHTSPLVSMHAYQITYKMYTYFYYGRNLRMKITQFQESFFFRCFLVALLLVPGVTVQIWAVIPQKMCSPQYITSMISTTHSPTRFTPCSIFISSLVAYQSYLKGVMVPAILGSESIQNSYHHILYFSFIFLYF